MEKTLVLFICLAVSLFCSCERKDSCPQSDIMIKVYSEDHDGQQIIYLSMENNSQNDLYLSGICGLVYGINVKRVSACVETDARFDLWEERSSEVELLIADNEEDWVKRVGTLGRESFYDSVVNELKNHITIGYCSDCGSNASTDDTINLIERLISCTFLPSGSKISDSIVLESEKWKGANLSIQFIYPSTYFQDYMIFTSNNPAVKRFYNENTISYPDTIFGYVHYQKPITSEIIKISF